MNFDLSFLFSIRGILAGAVALIATIQILRKPYVGLLFFLFLLMIRPHELEIFPGMETLPVIKIYTGVTILSILVHPEQWGSGYKFSFQQLLLLLLGFCLFASGNFSTEASEYFVDRFVPIIVIYILIIFLINNNERLKTFILTYVLFTTYLSLYGIYSHEVTGGHVLYDDGMDRIYYYGTMSDPNDLALVLVSAIPFILTFLGNAKKTSTKLFCTLALFSHIVAISWTYSRSGFLALVAVFLLYAITSVRKLVPITIAIAAILSITFFSSSLRERLIETNVTDVEQMDLSAEYRLELWAAGVDMIKSHPLTGVGMGQFSKNVLQYLDSDLPETRAQTAHNSFVLIAAEAGIPALILYLAIIILTFINLWIVYRRYRLRNIDFAMPVWSRPLIASIVGILISSLFLSQAYSWFFYILIAINETIRRNVVYRKEVPHEKSERLQPQIGRTEFSRRVL